MKAKHKAIVAGLVLSLLGVGEAHARIVNLHIMPNGHVRLDDAPEISLSQLDSEIRKLMSEQPRPDIRLSPDHLASYDTVAKVLQMFQRDGYGPHFGFVGFKKAD